MTTQTAAVDSTNTPVFGLIRSYSYFSISNRLTVFRSRNGVEVSQRGYSPTSRQLECICRQINTAIIVNPYCRATVYADGWSVRIRQEPHP